MKTLLFLIVFSSVTTTYSQQTDLYKSNLHGSVKSLRTIQYRAIQKKKKIKLGDVQPMVNFQIYYNEQGNDSIRCHYRFLNGVHSVSDSIAYQYTGVKKEKHIKYNSQGKQYGYGNYSYDLDSLLIAVEHYDMTDSMTQIWMYQYSQDGHFNIKEMVLSDTSTYAINSYNAQGSRLESIYRREGQISYTRKFNFGEDRIETSWIYSSQNVEAEYFIIYEFDNHKNWTKKTEILGGKAVYVSERKIEYH